MNENYTFRKVMLSDREDMTAISNKLWGGHDFIPRRFDEWVNDDKGEFAAVIHDGKFIGCGKLTFLTETDAWLQGLRKDIEADYKGVGKAVTKYFIDKLKKRTDITSFRFATYVKNYASIIANQSIGFRLQKTFSIKHSMVMPGTDWNYEKHTAEKITDADKVLQYIKKTKFFEYTGNDINLNWTVYPYSDDFIVERFINSGECFGILEDNQLKALALTCSSSRINMPFFDAEDYQYAFSLLQFIFGYTKKNNFDMVQIFLPDYPRIKKLFTRLSFSSWDQENDFLLFEYPLELLR